MRKRERLERIAAALHHTEPLLPAGPVPVHSRDGVHCRVTEYSGECRRIRVVTAMCRKCHERCRRHAAGWQRVAARRRRRGRRRRISFANLGRPLRPTGRVEGKGQGECGDRARKDYAAIVVSRSTAPTASMGQLRRLGHATPSPCPTATRDPIRCMEASSVRCAERLHARGATPSARSPSVGGRFGRYMHVKTGWISFNLEGASLV